MTKQSSVSLTVLLFDEWQRAERRALALRALADQRNADDPIRVALECAFAVTRSACTEAKAIYVQSMARNDRLTD